jgi:hypothetical protein
LRSVARCILHRTIKQDKKGTKYVLFKWNCVDYRCKWTQHLLRMSDTVPYLHMNTFQPADETNIGWHGETSTHEDGTSLEWLIVYCWWWWWWYWWITTAQSYSVYTHWWFFFYHHILTSNKHLYQMVW